MLHITFINIHIIRCIFNWTQIIPESMKISPKIELFRQRQISVFFKSKHRKTCKCCPVSLFIVSPLEFVILLVCISWAAVSKCILTGIVLIVVTSWSMKLKTVSHPKGQSCNIYNDVIVLLLLRMLFEHEGKTFKF